MYFENLVKQYLEENAELLELIVKYGTMWSYEETDIYFKNLVKIWDKKIE
jgi:transcription termination factor NusB